MSETRELKACPNPWCGEKQSMARVRDVPKPTFRVICKCGVMGPMALTEAEAIAAWNTRPTLSVEEVSQHPVLVALRDRLKEGPTFRGDQALVTAVEELTGLSRVTAASARDFAEGFKAAAAILAKLGETGR